MLWISGVFAAPQFEGEQSELVELAGRFWEEAERCVGRPGHAAETVPIDVGANLMAAGMAWIGPEGLTRIQMRTRFGRWTLARMVAHAWHHDQHPTLSAGLAEVTTMCMADALPDDIPWAFYTLPTMQGMPDLNQQWEFDWLAELGAATFFRVVALEKGRDFLMGTDWTLESLRAALHGTPLDLLSQPAEQQAALLADPDADGQVTLAEQLAGTDPQNWDSDGDGWWDGAPEHPDNAIPLPLDGRGVCMPHGEGKDWSDEDGSQPIVRLVTMDGDRVWKRDAGSEPWDAFRLAEGERGWIEPLVETTQKNPHCVMADGLTLRRTAAGSREDFWTLGELIQQYTAEAERRFGPRPPMEAVLEKGHHMHAVGDMAGRFEVSIPMTRFDESRDLNNLAATAVAMHWVYTHSDPMLHEKGLIAALGVELSGKRALNWALKVDNPTVKKWKKYAEKQGWEALLAVE